jgi:DNA repair exonuclease SbcCD ATPase subunit
MAQPARVLMFLALRAVRMLQASQRIRELEQQAEELKKALATRHPNSLAAVVHAAKPAPAETGLVRSLSQQVDQLHDDLRRKVGQLCLLYGLVTVAVIGQLCAAMTAGALAVSAWLGTDCRSCPCVLHSLLLSSHCAWIQPHCNDHDTYHDTKHMLLAHVLAQDAEYESQLRGLQQQLERVKQQYADRLAKAELGGKAKQRVKELERQIDDLRTAYSRRIRSLESRISQSAASSRRVSDAGPAKLAAGQAGKAPAGELLLLLLLLLLVTVPDAVQPTRLYL